MKQFRVLSLLIITAFFISCGVSNQSNSNSKTYFTIIQLNDVYEIAPIQGGKYGGMARVESVHQELLKENKNTMLILAGDFLSPSLLGTIKYNGERVRGKQMVEVMNAMNFDVVAFGNHEFDLSYTHLQDRLNESKFEWISANVLHNKNGKHSYFYKVVDGKKKSLQDAYIKEFETPEGTKLKVGFISVCIPSNPKSYVYYGDMYEEIKRSYNEIKDKVDIVIGITHASLTQDKQIAEILPNVPLIMGGHEHTNSYNKVGNVVITKADANAKTVYIHRFEYDSKTKEVQFKSELKEINNKIPFDKKVETVVNKWSVVLQDKIKEIVPEPYKVVYKATEPLDARENTIRSIQTNMGEIIATSMSFAYNNKVDCALVNGGSVRIDDILKGEVNAIDIFRVLPYGGKVLKVDIKGSLLKRVLDFGEAAAGTGAYLQRYNASKVNGVWVIKKQKIQEDKTYTVAFSDYLLRGLDIPILSDKKPEVLSVYKPELEEVAYDIRKAVVNYLEEK
ncbi:bifunctional metallophosphatase/5'-nucleotidase [Tenacibaculum caenipelagi]|uniref:2',3'-cyclic-nucleotide 2'-phosphodiesterase (5'-nucleotidase family) n=1 Tax=Tenacibaculum caenipelagi TaxID=1325435 RepID=A0A4V6PWA0_9FLAO|nr:bifunctional metallophosphatase/5'-nucleotidase [Tenacibaculum caenipelagi]TDQ29752.1 2',3'-cyclic-nucleotide 2'-phosphodiesterase (5'-nucleotidase family) [Tenacibaculum caenipelagi]